MKAEVYRIYMSDAARQLVENVAKGIGGGWIEKRYCDIIDPQPVDTRTPEERFYNAVASMGFTIAEGGDNAWI